MKAGLGGGGSIGDHADHPSVGHSQRMVAICLLLLLNGTGYAMAFANVQGSSQVRPVLVAIWLAVGLLTVTYGAVQPDRILRAARAISLAARRLANGTLADFSRAMDALGRGEMDAAYARIDVVPVTVDTHDEMTEMASSFNLLQAQIRLAAVGLDGAREGLRRARNELTEINDHLEHRVEERTAEVNQYARQLEREIAERRRAEAELSDQEARIRTILDSTADGILTIDETGVVRSFNKAAEKLYGFRAEEVVGQVASELQLGLSLKGSESAFRVPDSLGREQHLQGRRQDGSLVPLAVRTSQFKHGDETLLLVMVTDITERLAGQERIANLNKQLVRAARLAGMADMAHSVLHNVGNVLNSVNVSASLLSEKVHVSRISGIERVAHLLRDHEEDLGSLTRSGKGRALVDYVGKLAEQWKVEQQDLLRELEVLNRNVHHIRDIIARQQSAGEMLGVVEEVDVASLLDDALKISAPNAEQRGILIERSYAELPLLMLDRTKVLQVLVNLIRNALDALQGPEPRILLRTCYNGNGGVAIHVTDNGLGIEAEHLNRIFSYGFTTKKTGHGYGLHASAVAVQEMGGVLRAESRGRDCGSTFTITLPYSPAPRGG